MSLSSSSRLFGVFSKSRRRGEKEGAQVFSSQIHICEQTFHIFNWFSHRRNCRSRCAGDGNNRSNHLSFLSLSLTLIWSLNDCHVLDDQREEKSLLLLSPFDKWILSFVEGDYTSCVVVGSLCVICKEKRERSLPLHDTWKHINLSSLESLSQFERNVCVCSSISLTLLTLELWTWNVCVSWVFWTLFLFPFFLSPSSIILHTYTRLFLFLSM